MERDEKPAPPRWVDEADPSGADKRELLREGSELRAWPQARREAVWRAIEARAESRPLTFARLAALGAPALAVLLAVVVVVRSRGPHRLPVGELGQITLGDDARISAAPTADHPELRLEAGTIEAQVNHRPPGQPFTVVTPQVRVVVVGTHFTVKVEGARTEVSVQEGRVRVEAPAAQAYVSAGETLRSDDPRLQPPPKPVAPQPEENRLEKGVAVVPRCAELAGPDARDACFAGTAHGSGLDAENALVSLALERRDRGELPGAIEVLREYQSRFPGGIFAPEVGIELVHELADASRFDDARAAAEKLERMFPDDPRTPEVALLHARLLREHLARPADAVPLADRVSAATDAHLREAALFELAQDLDAAGRSPQAQRAWRKLLDLFPNGPHAGAAQAHLAP